MSLQSVCIAAISVIILSANPLYAAQSSIKYKNNRGSELTINIGKEHNVTGHFITAVASKSCPQAIGTKRPIIGYVSGNALTFSTVYPMCDSVLSFSGNFFDNKKSIDTLSILIHQAKDIIHQGPGDRFIGNDTFHKVG